ncbi:MAG: DUF2865 domain-containing protein [Bosea sp. (in: a-proteobacteria)]
MLRVRDPMPPIGAAAGVTREPVDRVLLRSPASRATHLAAMASVGLALGAGGAVLAVSMVQAGDDAGIRAFHQQEAANRRATSQHVAHQPAVAYAPSRSGWSLPLLQARPDGRIAHPPTALNPFARSGGEKRAQRARPRTQQGGQIALSNSARSICVRLCDGFHAPIGLVHSNNDMKAHQALCQAMNPGVPVQVFRVSAGATSIDEAQTSEGKRYNSLPVAFSHEKASDPACRPAIVKEGERRISLLRDFTLRPGDSVVLNGKVQTFMGGSRWPYSPRDFRDFRSAAELSKGQRKEIDDLVGLSRMEAEARSLRRRMAVREASLQDDSVASDALPLRGALGPAAKGPVRFIPLAATRP